MIKKMIVASMLLVLVSSKTTYAQTAFEMGKSVVSIGYGYQVLSIKSVFKVYDAVGFNGFAVSGMGPIRVNYEYALSEKVGVGVNMGYTAASVKFSADDIDGNGNAITYNYKYKYSKFTFVPRLNFHLGSNEKIDPYVGFGAGYKKVSYTLETNDPVFTGLSTTGIPLAFEATFGCRFLFSPNVGAYVEMGAGHGFLQFGVVAKF